MIKEERLLRVGVLGCGPIAQAAHFEACRRGRNTELYGICDMSRELADAMAVIHSPKAVYYDYDEMLADSLVEAVIIGIADQFHVPMASKALAAGKHVLVEKPLGVTVEECMTLADQAEKSGLQLQVGHMKRYDPGIAYARKFIREEMGEMLALKAWYCDSTYRYTVTDNVMPLPVNGSGILRPQGNPKEDKQRYYMLTHGSHLLDTARFLGGEILSVQARHVQKYGAYSWFVDVEFAGGSLGHLDLTVAVRMDWHEGFHIYGEHGSVTGKTYNPWLFKASEVEVFSAKDGVTRRPLGADAHFYKLQAEGFADSILYGHPSAGAGIHDGIAAMRGMAAIARSVETGGRVRLADVTGGV